MIEPNGTRTTRRPRPWLAGLLSFLAPGVGHVYTGKSKRGLTFYFGFLTLSGIVFASLRFGESLAAYLSVLSIGVVITILRIFAAIDAFLRARATGEIIPGRYQRTWIYIGLIVLDPILYTGMPDRMRGYVFSIPTDAMAPALLAGDQILSNRAPGLSPSPRRGEIVIFRSPSDWRIHYVKRVVGLPGDRIQIRHGILYVNGQPNSQQRISDYVIKTGLNEIRYAQYVESVPGTGSYLILQLNDDGSLDNTQIYDVPTNNYFLLGDNRDNSKDSRDLSNIGFVPAENIIGEPVMVYWPPTRFGTTIH